MSLDQLEQKVLSLPRDDDEISPAVRAEILRRRDEALAHPERMEPVTDDWFDSLKRKLTAIRELRSTTAA